MEKEQTSTNVQSVADDDSQQVVQRFLDKAPIAISIKDTTGRYLFANRVFCAMVRRDPSQVPGQCATDIFPQATAELMQAWDLYVLDTARAVDCELPLTQGDTLRTYYEKRFPLFDTNGQVYAIGILAWDVTDHKHEQEQFYSQQETSLVLRERERLVLEVQTTVGQMLDHINTHVQTVQEALATGDDAQASLLLTDVQALVRDTQHAMHASTLGMHIDEQDEPTFAALYAELGFVPALREYVQRFATRSGVPVHLSVSPQLQHEEFPPHVQIHVLHIIQETLVNAQRHHATHDVHIRLELVERTLLLSITDNGYQLQPRSAPQTQRRITDHAYGLRRIYEIGGEFQVEHGQQTGITIQVHIPLRRAGDLRAASLRVLLADASATTLQRIHDALVLYGIQVVGLAHDCEEMQDKARSLNPDIVLMDADLPHCNSRETLRALKAELPELQIVLLADTTEDTTLFDAIRNGASGYLLKTLPSDELTRLLLGVQRGEMALSPAMAHKVLAAFAEQEPQPTDAQPETSPATASDLSSQLSPRQMEILWLVAQDYTYKQVGEILGFSERTIKHYMSAIVKQLHLRNRADAIAFVRQRMSPPHNTPSQDTNTHP